MKISKKLFILIFLGIFLTVILFNISFKKEDKIYIEINNNISTLPDPNGCSNSGKSIFFTEKHSVYKFEYDCNNKKYIYNDNINELNKKFLEKSKIILNEISDDEFDEISECVENLISGKDYVEFIPENLLNFDGPSDFRVEYNLCIFNYAKNTKKCVNIYKNYINVNNKYYSSIWLEKLENLIKKYF